LAVGLGIVAWMFFIDNNSGMPTATNVAPVQQVRTAPIEDPVAASDDDDDDDSDFTSSLGDADDIDDTTRITEAADDEHVVPIPVENTENRAPRQPVANPTAGETTTSAKQYTLRQGDMLTQVALREYGNKLFWVYLYEENKDKIKDPNSVPANLTITIPPASKYGINKDDPASVQTAAALQSKIQATVQPRRQTRQPDYDDYDDYNYFPY